MKPHVSGSQHSELSLVRRFPRSPSHPQLQQNRGKLGVFKDDLSIAEPGDDWAIPVQGGLAQDWVVRPLVEAHYHAVRLDRHHTARLHKAAVELLRLRLL